MRKLLKWHKSKVLVEVKTDLAFLRLYKEDKVNYDEKDARKQIASLRMSDLDENEKDRRIAMISDDLHSAQAVKAEYEKLLAMEGDLAKYITLL